MMIRGVFRSELAPTREGGGVPDLSLLTCTLYLVGLRLASSDESQVVLSRDVSRGEAAGLLAVNMMTARDDL